MIPRILFPLIKEGPRPRREVGQSIHFTGTDGHGSSNCNFGGARAAILFSDPERCCLQSVRQGDLLTNATGRDRLSVEGFLWVNDRVRFCN